MFEVFEVDTTYPGYLLKQGGLSQQEIGEFVIQFDALDRRNKDSFKKGRVGGFFKPSEGPRVHVIAGQIDDMAYKRTMSASFEGVITHEIGHFLHYRQHPFLFLLTSKYEKERRAESYAFRNSTALGNIVTYQFKPEFVDAIGAMNIYSTWHDLTSNLGFQVVDVA